MHELSSFNKASKSKSVCLDFDGVIHSYKSGWQGAAKITDPPVEGAFSFIYDLINNGYAIYIYSARSGQNGGISAMKEWINKYDNEYRQDQYKVKKGLPRTSVVRWCQFPTSKPPADLYIDDNGFRFNGVFPSVDSISEMKSWVHKAKLISRMNDFIQKASDDKKTFVPPDAVANAAKRAIEAKEKYGNKVKGGTSVGWTRARQLASKENISYKTIKRMHSFFSRHEGNQKVDGDFKWGDNGFTAWEIWGGDAGKRWAASIVRQMEDKE